MPFPRIGEIILEMGKAGINTSYDYCEGVTTLIFTKKAIDGRCLGVTIQLEPDLPEELIHLYLENVKLRLASAVLAHETNNWNPSFRNSNQKEIELLRARRRLR